MYTPETSILFGNIIYTAQQLGSFGSVPIFSYPGLSLPTIENFLREKTEELEVERLFIPEGINVLELAQNYYKTHRESLLRKYEGKYIAILNNKVIGSGKDFSNLAQRVYKKYGYQTIYMPFVVAKERILIIPSPTIKNA